MVPVYLLALETAGPYASVALFGGPEPQRRPKLLGVETSLATMDHLSRLLPMADSLLRRYDVPKNGLTHIAADVGPGSFTGIRIGVSTARALGQALDLPLVGVPGLEAFLYKDCEGPWGPEAIVCAILNARRGQVYGMIEGMLSPRPCMLTDVLATIRERLRPQERPLVFFGDGIDAYEQDIVTDLVDADFRLGRDFFFAPQEVRYQDAAAVGRLALRRIADGRTVDWEGLQPDYMRRTEAETKLRAGQLPICHLPEQR